jgi:hypothetical protein
MIFKTYVYPTHLIPKIRKNPIHRAFNFYLNTHFLITIIMHKFFHFIFHNFIKLSYKTYSYFYQKQTPQNPPKPPKTPQKAPFLR